MIPRLTLQAFAFLLIPFSLQAADNAESPLPPVTWVDQDTGHRVWRLSDEPGSSGLYFNLNAYTPDQKTVVYTTPDGFHAIDLATKKTRLILAKEGVNQRAQIMEVGHKTNSVFFTRSEPSDPANPTQKLRSLCKVDVYTGEVTKLAMIPSMPGAYLDCVNADETLAAGVYEDGPAEPGSDYDPKGWLPPLGPDGKPKKGPLVQAVNKEEMMDRRFAAHIPMVLFTINLQTGTVTKLLRTTDWIDHFLFSPADPTLLMYAHEGKWHKVDRIWFVRTDTAENTLIHKRLMVGEVAGHEFWGLDGKSIWFDLQTPPGPIYYLAQYNTETKQRTWYNLNPMDRSLHFNVTEDESLFCGDGSDPALARGSLEVAWIKLFHPQVRKRDGIDTTDLVHVNSVQMERLVNMAKHDYRLEPNVRFTPDKKMILFTGTMFGPSYVFGVEVAKAAPEASAPQK